jgi:hypothetical protein
MSASESPYASIARLIAEEALPDALHFADRTVDGWGPVYLYATKSGTWQIHSTSKIVSLDASVPLTRTTTASVAALTAALVDSFEKTAAYYATQRVALD